MHKLFSILLILLVTFGLVINEANAKRFGGGRSFGVSRSVSSFARPSINPTAMPNAQRNGTNRWLGPLAGFAAGGLLASLFMGHGIGNGIFSWLIIGFIGMFIWNLFRRNMPQPVQYNASNGNTFQDNISHFTNQANATANNTPSYPAGFDAPTFLRDAKVQFIRLQAAYDTKNLTDLREFTSPEVFAEMQMQFQERGDVANHTEVVSIDAQLLDAVHEPEAMLASVRFSGLIREDLSAATSFNEIWHFRKSDVSSKWIVAGVQQE
jgi:predicted lipid-binding transport protein (Tim44 family)